MGAPDFTRFREVLDDCHDWPVDYLFKFIAPAERFPELLALFPDVTLSKRASRGGRWVSITVTLTVRSADDVVAIYEQAAGIEGIISL